MKRTYEMNVRNKHGITSYIVILFTPLLSKQIVMMEKEKNDLCGEITWFIIGTLHPLIETDYHLYFSSDIFISQA